MACWLIVAGAADSVEFAKSERIGDIMHLALPSARVETHSVLPREWPKFIEDKIAELGAEAEIWREAKCLVWNKSGKLVGDAAAFETFVESRYRISCDLDEAGIQRNATANLQNCIQQLQQAQLKLKRDAVRAIVVVDMQVDFSGTGRLGTGAVFDDVLPIVNCILRHSSWESIVCTQLLQTYDDFREGVLATAEAQWQQQQHLLQRQQQRQHTPMSTSDELANTEREQVARPISTAESATVSFALDQTREAAVKFLDLYPHCIAGEVGAQVHPYLQVGVTAPAVTVSHNKRKDFKPLLDRMVSQWHDNGVQEVFLCGVALDGAICDLARALKGQGFEVYIISNATCEIAPERHITSSTKTYRVINSNELPINVGVANDT